MRKQLKPDVDDENQPNARSSVRAGALRGSFVVVKYLSTGPTSSRYFLLYLYRC